MKINSSLLVLIAFFYVYSQEISYSVDTIKFVDTLRYDNQLEMYHHDFQKKSSDEFSNSCGDDCYAFTFVYEDSLFGNKKRAEISFAKDSIYIYAIPGTPKTTFFREDHKCFLDHIAPDNVKMKEYCSKAIPLPPQLKKILHKFFKDEYLSLNGFSDRLYYYTYEKEGHVWVIELLSDSTKIEALSDFFSDYKELYLLTNKYLIHKDNRCTWQNILENFEKICRVSR